MIEQKIYKVGIYVRLSKDDEREGESVSIENQKLLLQKHVNEQGWIEAKVYSDDGYSGTSFERPAFQEMIEDATDGAINLIIVKDLSRFGRNYIQVGQYTDYIFPSLGCRFIALNDGVDTINNDNDMMPFRNLFNEFYSRDTSKKIKAVKTSSAQQGKHIGSHPPYGYKTDPDNKDKFIIDVEVADVVRRIFELRLEGYGIRKIAFLFNDEGIIPPREYYYKNKGSESPYGNNLLWTDASIKAIIQNEAYIGNTVQMKYGTMSYKNKKQIKKPEEDWIRVENTHEPIISLETWEKEKELENKRYKPRDTKNKIVNMFVGKIVCADCGSSMRISQDKRITKDGRNVSYVSYRCGRNSKAGKMACGTHFISLKILLEMLKKDIQKNLDKILYDENAAIAEIEQKLNENETSKQGALKNAERKLQIRLDELIRLSQALYEDKVSGKVPEDLYLTLIQKYEHERAEKKEQLKEAQDKINKITQTQKDVANWIELLKRYMSIEELDKNTINELIDKIEIGERLIIDGVNHQSIKVYYQFVGNID